MQALRWHRTASALGGAALIAAALAMAPPPAVAKTSHCFIINNGIDTSYKNLQSAVNGASPGATLWLRGTCLGGVAINKDLTLEGQSFPRGFTAPKLTGSTTVLTIQKNTTVTVENLTVEGGSAAAGAGGINNLGTLTVMDSTVQNNHGSFGGGILNAGTLTISDSTVQHNTAAYGAGIDNQGALTVVGSTIQQNQASVGGGGINAVVGTVTVTGSMVRDNQAGVLGGGIYNSRGSRLTLASSTVQDNQALYGGGIANLFGGVLNLMTGDTITGNTATAKVGGGGGVNTYGSTTEVNGAPLADVSPATLGAIVFGNSPTNLVG